MIMWLFLHELSDIDLKRCVNFMHKHIKKFFADCKIKLSTLEK